MNRYHWAAICATFFAWPVVLQGHYGVGLLSWIVAFVLFIGIVFAFSSANKYIYFAIGAVVIALPQIRRGGLALGLVIGVAAFLLMASAALLYDKLIKPFRVRSASKKVAAEREKLTPLLVAAADGDDIAVEQLLSSGRDVNETGPNGETALIMAARNDKRSTVRLLLRSGANLDAKTSRGNDALDIAKKFNHSVIVEILEESRVGQKDKPNDQPKAGSNVDTAK